MELDLYRSLLMIWPLVGLITFVVLQFISAPYGRHARPGWGPHIHRIPGWIGMELPALLTIAILFFLSDRRGNLVSMVFVGLWVSHYGYRSLIYPFRLRGGQIYMPLTVVGMGILFNLMNGYLHGRGLFTFGPIRSSEWFLDPRFIFGSFLFFLGQIVNHHSDAILRRLRSKTVTRQYSIPQGGAYRWVSCPNYLGELIEWLGWAILTWSTAGFLFFFWTACNLIPRARTHHAWYQKTFTDYPKDRKRIIPFLY